MGATVGEGAVKIGESEPFDDELLPPHALRIKAVLARTIAVFGNEVLRSVRSGRIIVFLLWMSS